MDGTLCGTLDKYTNIFGGWQARHVVLVPEDGTLAYYLRAEDVTGGAAARGCFKLQFADINAGPTDPRLFDVTVGAGHTIFFRAVSEAECRHWVSALRQTKLAHQAAMSMVAVDVTPSILNESAVRVASTPSKIDGLRRRLGSKAEILQRASGGLLPGVRGELAEIVSLCHELCDALENLSTNGAVVQPDLRVIAPVASSCGKTAVAVNSSPLASAAATAHDADQSSGGSDFGDNEAEGHDVDGPDTAAQRTSPLATPSALESKSESFAVRPAADESFFSRAPHKVPQAREVDSFTCNVQFCDVPIQADGFISTRAFLDACKVILPFIDQLGPTTFAPVKADISGNIGKLEKHFTADPDRCATLQGMVGVEVGLHTTAKKNSATDALLWLRRALEFINALLTEVVTRSEDKSLTAAAGNAYARTLAPHHNFVVRQLFTVVMTCVPYRADLLRALGPADARVVIGDMSLFTADLGRILAILTAFYDANVPRS